MNSSSQFKTIDINHKKEKTIKLGKGQYYMEKVSAIALQPSHFKQKITQATYSEILKLRASGKMVKCVATMDNINT